MNDTESRMVHGFIPSSPHGCFKMFQDVLQVSDPLNSFVRRFFDLSRVLEVARNVPPLAGEAEADFSLISFAVVLERRSQSLMVPSAENATYSGHLETSTVRISTPVKTFHRRRE